MKVMLIMLITVMWISLYFVCRLFKVAPNKMWNQDSLEVENSLPEIGVL